MKHVFGYRRLKRKKRKRADIHNGEGKEVI